MVIILCYRPCAMYLVQTYTDFTLKFETHSNYGETYESGETIGNKFEGKRWKSCNNAISGT